MTFPSHARRAEKILNTLNEMLFDRPEKYIKIDLPTDPDKIYTSQAHSHLSDKDVTIVLLAHKPGSELKQDEKQHPVNFLVLHHHEKKSLGIGTLREIASIVASEPYFKHVVSILMLYDVNVTKQTRINVKSKEELDLVKFEWQFVESGGFTRNPRKAANVNYELVSEAEIQELKKSKGHKRDEFPPISASRDPVLAYYGYKPGQMIKHIRFSEMAGTATDYYYVTA